MWMTGQRVKLFFFSCRSPGLLASNFPSPVLCPSTSRKFPWQTKELICFRRQVSYLSSTCKHCCYCRLEQMGMEEFPPLRLSCIAGDQNPERQHGRRELGNRHSQKRAWIWRVPDSGCAQPLQHRAAGCCMRVARTSGAAAVHGNTLPRHKRVSEHEPTTRAL